MDHMLLDSVAGISSQTAATDVVQHKALGDEGDLVI